MRKTVATSPLFFFHAKRVSRCFARGTTAAAGEVTPAACNNAMASATATASTRARARARARARVRAGCWAGVKGWAGLGLGSLLGPLVSYACTEARAADLVASSVVLARVNVHGVSHPRRGPFEHRGSRFAAARRRGPPPHDAGARRASEPPVSRVQAAGACRSGASGQGPVERVAAVRGRRLRSTADEAVLRVRLLGAPRSRPLATQLLLVAVHHPAPRLAASADLQARERVLFEARA